MKILKNLALGLLSFLLFLSLSIFGLAFMLNSTIFNPNFITSELDELDVSSVVEEFFIEQPTEEGVPEEFETALINTIAKLEPVVKEQLNTAIDSIYDYLLGRSENLDLALILGNTFFNSDFVVSLLEELDISSLAADLLTEDIPEEFEVALLNTLTKLEPQVKEQIGSAANPIFDYLLGKSQNLDLALTLRNTILTSDLVLSLMDELAIASLASEFLSEELTGLIPEEMEFLAEHLDEAITLLEPTIKEELSAAADPMLDYLLGQRQSVSIVISLEPVKETLEGILREVLMEQLPPEYANLSQGALDRLFAEYFTELTAEMPSTFDIGGMLEAAMPADVITEGLVTAEGELGQVRQDIAEALTDAEEQIEEARQYVGYFQLGYKLLIGFMVLLILGIIIINRQVKSASRGLGITFLTYGALELIGIFVANYFAGVRLPLSELPSSLQTWLPQLLDNLMAPLEMLSLGLLIGGVALIVVSFVYPRWRQPES